MERFSVDVNVGRTLRSFIIQTNGSSVVDPDKGSILWCLVKQHLNLRPQQEYSLPEVDGVIKILLRSGDSIKTYSHTRSGLLNCNMLYRCYLDEIGQASIRRHFEKNMKHLFHVFMAGYMAANPEAGILYAITDFCLEYNIEFDNTTLGALRKDWYRYRQKSTETKICPLVF
ncbi:MAG: hypothetical protein PHF92_08340 [Bacteroidales bacterium]|nr:hypothetical protein [Bacteroidales bacterium]